MKNIKSFGLIIIMIMELLACSKKNNQSVQQYEILENIETKEASNINSFVDDSFDDSIKQIIVDYYTSNNTRTYELEEIKIIDIGIKSMDCYITIWKLIDDYLDGYIIHNYDFIGLRNNEIIIDKRLAKGHLQTPFENFEGYKYPELLMNFLSDINDFHRIEGDLVLIGDVNRDGNNDIIIFTYSEGFPPYINIWGVNIKGDNISEYLSAFFQITNNNTPFVFNNDGSLKLYKREVSPSFSDCIWDNTQKKYIENW